MEIQLHEFALNVNVFYIGLDEGHSFPWHRPSVYCCKQALDGKE
jgi:hypothetical protein